MSPPLVSVLIPCYNSGRFVAAAIESVLEQDHPALEIIIVDDGSTDDSREVISRYVGRGVRMITQANAGQCAAANAALANSSGELIKFLDADDILGAGSISSQVAALSGRTDAIAFGQWDRFYGDDPARASFPPRTMYWTTDPVTWLTTEWKGARPMMQCALWLIPRAILAKSGHWDERLSLINDFEFFARVLLCARELVYVPEARLYYRSGIGGTLSSQKTRKAVESAFLSILLGTGHLLASEDSPRVRASCADLFKDFDYSYFPRFPDLRRQARRRCLDLGGSDLAPDGPPRFQQLRRVIGWHAARLVQLAARSVFPPSKPAIS